jgi:hypothetical protein
MVGKGTYRTKEEKDVVGKAFMHSRPYMEPLYARTEEGTRARIFLSILGYSMIRMIAHMCDLSQPEREDPFRYKGSCIQQWITCTCGTHKGTEIAA